MFGFPSPPLLFDTTTRGTENSAKTLVKDSVAQQTPPLFSHSVATADSLLDSAGISFSGFPIFIRTELVWWAATACFGLKGVRIGEAHFFPLPSLLPSRHRLLRRLRLIWSIPLFGPSTPSYSPDTAIGSEKRQKNP